jgi:hypothetical protein
MGTMSQQLQDLRGQYLSELTEAEEEARRLQVRISDWRGKIAAIDTLIGGPEIDAEGEAAAEEEDTSDENAVFTPVHDYWKPILEALVEMGGRGKRLRVIDAVGTKMKGILTPADYGKLPKSGWVRWRNRVAWQASNMRAQGLIKNDPPTRGLWEIADAGRKWLDDNNS